MKEDKLLQLAADMAERLESNQKQKLAKSKRILNKAKELEEKLNEFEETKDILTDI